MDDCTARHSNTLALRTEGENFELPQKDLRVLLDWVGFTFSYEFWDLIKVKAFFHAFLDIPLDAWKPFQKNYQGYAESLKFENIIIYYMGEEEQGIHIDITGQGCRNCEQRFSAKGILENNWSTFFERIIGGGGQFTRIDLACDDFTGHFKVIDLYDKLRKGEATSKFKKWSPDGNFDFDGKDQGLTLNFGSKTSRIYLVIYEKNKQLDLSGIWNRLELRFRKERAEELVYKIINRNDPDKEQHKSIGVIFAGILKNYLQFRDKKETDSNKRRWPISKFWSDLLSECERIELTTAVPDASIERKRMWIDKSVSKSIAMLYFAYQDIEGYEEWLKDIFKEGASRLDPSDLETIEQFRRKNKRALGRGSDK